MENQFPNLEKLLWVMDKLRDPQQGCPWDLKQDFATIVPYTLEEAYEVADAIESGDMDEVKAELGDLLFQVVFYARLGKEQQLFDFEAIAEGIVEKLIRRHPHVFAEQVFTEEQVKANWEAEKAKERAQKKSHEKVSILDNIPKTLPALTRAAKVQKRCGNVGFDWPDLNGVFGKIYEELDEVKAELDAENIDQTAVEEEIGDLLFATVNLARKLKKDPEQLLRQANTKFEQRFHKVEQHFEQQGVALEDAGLEAMDNVWNQIKHQK
jgi:ATP diphosphatase